MGRREAKYRRCNLARTLHYLPADAGGVGVAGSELPFTSES